MAEGLISGLLEQLFPMVQTEGLIRGVEKDVGKLLKNLTLVQAVLFDADQKQLLDEPVRLWVDKVQDFCYDADGVLDEWRTVILKLKIKKEDVREVFPPSKKVCFCVPTPYLSCNIVQFHRVRRDIARKINELNEKLCEIAHEKEEFTFEKRAIKEELRMATFSTSFVVGSDIYGRDMEKKTLVDLLLGESSISNVGLEIIPIVGMGGLGKTTLAQLAFNNDMVKSHFKTRIWVHVGDPFDLVRIVKAIIEAISGSIPELFELESLLSYMNKSIQGKRFLLVLDDVWFEDWTKWQSLEGSLKHGAVGSRVLVTTQKETVVDIMGAKKRMICLRTLSDEHCWQIFKNLASKERQKSEALEEIGREIIVTKCKGIPLVAKTLGIILMHSKDSIEEWESVLNINQLWELPDVRQIVFAPFLLSYYDLSPFEKLCLSYCSLFPLDYNIDKDDLIELWMSQGIFDANKNYEMGEKCFESLAMRSFFQDFAYNFDGEITTCKMHGVIHDFLQFVTRNSCFIGEGFGGEERKNQVIKTTRHYTLLLIRSRAQIPIPVYVKKNLRTLFVIRARLETPAPLNLKRLSELASLWTLCLSECGIERLPSGIDKLIHLRYFNLSDNSKLEELPHELCNLLNLQTLRLNGCTKLRSLPRQMGKLVNLLHLYIEGCNRLQGLPKGIGRLSSLRRLDVFIVPCDYLENNTEMNLGDFNNLKHLRGHLHIRRIGNVQHAADAEEAHLKAKPNLADLQLCFSQQHTGPRRTEDEWKVLLDVLQPPPDLKSLEIRKYNGATFSHWIVSLENLRRLVLNFCPNCVFLPPFGKLPSLEILHIENMDKLVTVGPEFLGVETGGDTSEIESFSVSFPKLKKLCFQDLNNWNQWLGIDDSMSSLTIMPSLRSLNIANCIKLRTLPDFMPTVPVQELTIDNCPSLDKEKNWSKISHIANIRKVGNDNELDSLGRPQHEKVIIDESEEKSSKGKGKEDERKKISMEEGSHDKERDSK